MKYKYSSTCIFILSLFIFFGCSIDKSSLESLPKLKVSTKESSPSIFDLFEKGELIPLETTTESLIKLAYKIEIDNDHKIYLLDKIQSEIFIYDDDGKFQMKISKKGQGPGEYALLMDFTLNKEKKRIECLSPFGFVYYYDLHGNFIESHQLPKPPLNYHRIEKLPNDYYLTWSFTHSDEKQINVFTSDKFDTIYNQFFSSIEPVNSFTLGLVHSFYNYNENCYFYNALSNTVYLVTPDGLIEDYEWKFNEIDITQIAKQFKDDDGEKLITKMKNSEIPFYYYKQYQNKKYYYAQLVCDYQWENKKSLFYDKESQSHMLIKQTKEGISFEPIYFNDEYMIDLINFSDKESILNSGMLNEESKNKLLNYTEEDNPWLIKYYFKTN